MLRFSFMLDTMLRVAGGGLRGNKKYTPVYPNSRLLRRQPEEKISPVLRGHEIFLHDFHCSLKVFQEAGQ